MDVVVVKVNSIITFSYVEIIVLEELHAALSLIKTTVQILGAEKMTLLKAQATTKFLLEKSKDGSSVIAQLLVKASDGGTIVAIAGIL